jgi:tetratricopeptide (TPR) repeat protein
MRDPNKKANSPVNASDVCHRAFELMAAKQYADAEKLVAGNMSRTDDDASIALYHSVLGVLFKLQGEYKTAWKHYQRAEKLLPKDPALKIISARLLIEQFAEYDQAIKKAKKVLEIIPENPVFAHQAHTTIGLAMLKRGDRRKALSHFKKSWGDDFKGFVSGKNIDFTLLEVLVRRGYGLKECRQFLSKALAFVEDAGDEPYIKLVGTMIEAFDRENPEFAEAPIPAGAATEITSETSGEDTKEEVNEQ